MLRMSAAPNGREFLADRGGPIVIMGDDSAAGPEMVSCVLAPLKLSRAP